MTPMMCCGRITWLRTRFSSMARSLTFGARARCRSSGETRAAGAFGFAAWASRCARSTAGVKTATATNRLKKKLRTRFIINVPPSEFVFVTWPTECGLLPSEKNLRSEEHTSELQSHLNLVCRLLLEKKMTDDKRTI